MYCAEATHCCAVNEFEGLNQRAFTPEGALKCMGESFVYDAFDSSQAWAHCVMFQKWNNPTDPLRDNLTRLAKYIDEHNLGTLTIGRAKRNPNSGNTVQPAIFTPAVGRFTKWLAARGISRRRW